MFTKPELQQLYQYCYSLTVDTGAAEDLLQNAAEKMLRHQKSAPALENIGGYMRTIIRNQIILDNPVAIIESGPFTHRSL